MKRILLTEGDITRVDADAIVNPSNTSLILGAGVSGAIATAGGARVQEEMSAIGHCPVGGAVITGAGKLKARYVIHAVGPRMGEGDEDEKLRSATLHALLVAEENQLESIAFPAISTGVFGYPMERCAQVMLTTAKDFLLSDQDRNLERILFCLFGKESHAIFRATLDQM